VVGLGLLLFLKFLSLAFILYYVAASLPKCLYRNREKLAKNAEFSNTIGPFPIFYGGEWDTCIFDVFTAGFSGEKI